jgi:ubiquinone/menaquinone biosynthesis C-methylase UbiE
MSGTSPAFAGSIPDAYDRYLRPLLFEPYAIDLATRVPLRPGLKVLELACGTGVLTRALLGMLPGDATLVATDLSEQMLAIAQQQVSPDERLAWQPVDAMTLPFDEGSFDVIAIQFGIMFFPDKAAALREIRRVLKPGGTLLFNAWDSMERNQVALIAHQTLARVYQTHPPAFLQTPYGFFDTAAIEALVRDAGFRDIRIATVAHDGHSPAARDAARGFVTGTPVAAQIAQSGDSVERGVDAVEREYAARFGGGELTVALSAIGVDAR